MLNCVKYQIKNFHLALCIISVCVRWKFKNRNKEQN